METISIETLLDESDILFIQTSSGEYHEPDNGIEENTEQSAYEENTQQKMNAVRSVIFMVGDHPDLEDELMLPPEQNPSATKIGKETSMNQTSIFFF
ncbi:hypothetical protein L917_20787 [Phytophthora nicotianae]|nr:hypothetical protein L917_20787 [Phytophthora nicotianae]ETO60082.1 hypothetical protein F444_21686 [Phytophthora nicotianae P1976]